MTFCCLLVMSLSIPPTIMFPYTDVECFIVGFKSSGDLSESVSEGALEKWDFLKPQVAGSSRAGCQHAALEYHVKWFILFGFA